MPLVSETSCALNVALHNAIIHDLYLFRKARSEDIVLLVLARRVITRDLFIPVSVPPVVSASTGRALRLACTYKDSQVRGNLTLLRLQRLSTGKILTQELDH